MTRGRMRQLAAATLAGAFLLGGCDDSPTEPPVDPVPDAMEVSPEELSFASLGASEQLSVTVWDGDGDEIADPAVTFSSSDESVATVDEDGVVTSTGNGSTAVTVQSGDVSESVTVTIEQVADAVEVTPDEVTLTEAGQIEGLSAVVLDAEGSEIEGTEVIWSSSDEEVVTVDEAGQIEAVGEGTALVTATAGDVSGSAEVTVNLDD